MALVIHPLYILLIKDFAHPLTLLKVPWTIVASAMATCLTDAIVRSWFTYRIWILGNKRWTITGSLAVLIVAAFVTGIWVNSEAFKASQVLSSFDKTAWLFYTNFALSLTADIYIAACLCYQLYRRKASYNSRSTNSMLNFLMVYAVNTGLLTAIINLGSLITHAVMPGNYVFLGIFFMLGPLYVNALMGSLNARDWFRQNTSDHITIPLSTLHVSPPSDDASTRDGYYHDHSTNVFKPGRHAVVVTKDKHVEAM